jgi:hypothetical protein
MEVLMIKKTQQNKSTNIKKNTNYEQYNIQAWLKNNE